MRFGQRVGSEYRFTCIAVALAASVVWLWCYRYAFTMTGFAEDLGVVAQLQSSPTWAEHWAVIKERWIGPLWGQGSTMWRPLPYSSLALDVWWWGSDAGMLRLTNFALHWLFAAGCGILAHRLTQSALVAVCSFAFALLNPLQPELNFWLVGRFDGWANLAIVSSLISASYAQASLRWAIASAVCALVAYASKESAVIVAPLVVALRATLYDWSSNRGSFVRTRLSAAHNFMRQEKVLFALHALICIAYLVARVKLLGASKADVLGRSSSEVLAILSASWQVPLALIRNIASIDTTSKAALTVFISAVAIAALAQCWRRYSRQSGGNVSSAALKRAIFFCLVWIALVCVANGAVVPTLALGDVVPLRTFSTAVPAIALFSAVLILGMPVRLQRLIVFTLLLSASLLLVRSTRPWHDAAIEISSTERALVPIIAKHRADGGLGVVLVAEYLGSVPTLVNANASIVRIAGGFQPPFMKPGTQPTIDNIVTSPASDPVSYTLAMTPSAMEAWWGLFRSADMLKRMLKRDDLPNEPTAFYCKPPGQPAVVALGAWSATALSQRDWGNRWREEVQTHCPQLLNVGAIRR